MSTDASNHALLAGPSGADGTQRLYILLYDHTDWAAGRFPIPFLWERYIRPSHIELLKQWPEVRVGNEYGGGFYDFLDAQTDPAAVDCWRELRVHLANAQVSVVGGTYSQAVSALLSEEAGIRQFTYGLQSIREKAAKDVSVYAFSENTGWAYLPQILNDFGYRGALLRTHWAPLGFAPSYRASIGYWEGPDGSRVPAVPSYPRDNLKRGYKGLNRGEAEIMDWVQYVPEIPTVTKPIDRINRYYEEKKAQGIDYVVMSLVEDALIHSHLDALMPDIRAADPEGRRYRFVRAEDLFEILPLPEDAPVFAVKPREWSFSWNAGYHGNLLSLWCNEINSLLSDTEKLRAFWSLSGGETATDYIHDIDLGWKDLINAEAHDAYLVPETTPTALNQLIHAKMTVAPIKEHLLSDLSRRISTGHDGPTIVVYNTLAFDRTEPIEVTVALKPGERIGSIIEGATGQSVPYDVLHIRESAGKRDASVVLLANVYGLGHSAYCVLMEPGTQDTTLQSQADALGRLRSEGAFTVANRHVTITFAPTGEIAEMGGSDGPPILSSGDLEASHYFTGFVYPLGDPEQGSMCRSESSISAIDEGNLLTRVSVAGRLGNQFHSCAVTVYKDVPYVDFGVDFRFASGIGVGDRPKSQDEAWGETDENTRRKRLTVNMRPAFQLATGEQDPWSDDYPLYSPDAYNAATNVSRCTPFWPERYGRYSEFDTCQSWPDTLPSHIYDINTRYWLDVSDTDGSKGFLLLACGSSAFVYDGNLLSMVLAQGTEHVPLAVPLAATRAAFGERDPAGDGDYRWDYRLVPHLTKESNTRYLTAGGSYVDSHRLGLAYSNPMVSTVFRGAGGEIPSRFQYLSVPQDGTMMLSALRAQGDLLYMRVYEYGGRDLGPVEVSSSTWGPVTLEPVSMDFTQARPESGVRISPYAIRTFRLRLPGAAVQPGRSGNGAAQEGTA